MANRTYEDQASRTELAKTIAREGIVLLKNENHILPLHPNSPVAVFGRGLIETQIGGSGSGASDSKNASTIMDGLLGLGFNLDQELAAEYQKQLSLEPKQEMNDFMEIITSGYIYEIWGVYNPPAKELALDDKVVAASAGKAETAIIVISRNSGGEESDRKVVDDYYLQPSEKALIEQVTSNFRHVVVVFNTNGYVDTAWTNDYKNIEGLVYLGLPGEAGGTALAEVLAGTYSPSGKLTATMALSYDDYPTAAHFSYNKDLPGSILTYDSYGLDAGANGSTGFNLSPVTVYKEGIYLGYRYFDTFGKKVMFPFGHGLSYTNFEITNVAASIDKEQEIIRVTADVRNTGETYSGQEVVQVYVSEADGKLEKPYQKLTVFSKTKDLAPGEKQTLALNFPFSELASYDQETASYLIEAGDYLLRVGNSSRNTHVVGKISVPVAIVTEQLSNQLALHPANQGKIEFLSKEGVSSITYEGESEEISSAACVGVIARDDLTFKEIDPANLFEELAIAHTEFSLEDVKQGKITMEQFVAQLTKEELAVLVNGHGKGVPFGGIGLEVPDSISYENGKDIGSNTHPTGQNNYVSPGIERLGIASIFYKDGPAGVRMTAWPIQTVMANTWNRELLYEFGDAAGQEAESQQVDSWLAPAVNLHRNPIGGRNFEYYSEDPLLSGTCAVAVANGVQENHPVTVCAKHFALNEQETYRRGHSKRNIDAVDSIVEERVARELYLKPFEMLVKQTKMMNIMTSFNKINGVFAAGSHDLNTSILKEEWDFNGFVVTDWGDMDTVVDGADAIAAGNDIVMPGGPPVIKQVLAGLEEGRCTMADLQRNVINLLNFVVNSEAFKVQSCKVK